MEKLFQSFHLSIDFWSMIQEIPPKGVLDRWEAWFRPGNWRERIDQDIQQNLRELLRIPTKRQRLTPLRDQVTF